MRAVLAVMVAAITGCGGSGEDLHPSGYVLVPCGQITLDCVTQQPYSWPDSRCASGQAGYGDCHGYPATCTGDVYVVCR